MSSMEPANAVSIVDFLMGGIKAGLLSLVLNVAYSYIYIAVTGFTIPSFMSAGGIASASFFLSVFGALVYFFIDRMSRHGFKIFIGLSCLVTAASLLGPFSTRLPDGTPTPAGFSGFAAPMHIITCICCIFMVQYSIARAKERL